MTVSAPAISFYSSPKAAESWTPTLVVACWLVAALQQKIFYFFLMLDRGLNTTSESPYTTKQSPCDFLSSLQSQTTKKKKFCLCQHVKVKKATGQN